MSKFEILGFSALQEEILEMVKRNLYLLVILILHLTFNKIVKELWLVIKSFFILANKKNCYNLVVLI